LGVHQGVQLGVQLGVHLGPYWEFTWKITGENAERTNIEPNIVPSAERTNIVLKGVNSEICHTLKEIMVNCVIV
jgi:hypothetical protein